MTYAEFKAEQDLKWKQGMEERQRRANEAYNQGLWDAVKWNPFKWWAFFAYKRSL